MWHLMQYKRFVLITHARSADTVKPAYRMKEDCSYITNTARQGNAVEAIRQPKMKRGYRPGKITHEEDIAIDYEPPVPTRKRERAPPA